MTFRPTKCYVWADLDKSLVRGSDRAPYVYRRKHKNLHAALLVPLVPGMEAVVRAHLAAKPKPAKKARKK